MGVGQDWVSFFGGEKDEVIWPHRPEKNIMTKRTSCYMKGRGKRTDLQIPRSRIGKTVHGGCVPISD